MGTLSNPSIMVNNTVIGIIPNSLSAKSGKGNITLRPQSSGGNGIQVIKTVDAETKKGMVKFSVYNTKTNADLIQEWQDAVDGVTIRLSEDDFVLSFQRMFVMEDPELNFGADGNFEVTFEGQPAVI